MFDNDTRRFAHDPKLMNGRWFVSAANQLYIIVEDLSSDEGPDDDIMYRLRRGVIPEDLQPVPEALKRFTVEDGYYVA